jgi:hypothetical protein
MHSNLQKDPVKWSKKIGFLFMAFCRMLNADQVEEYEPLYAGTQLAFYPLNAAPGHLSVQPFLFFSRSSGLYNTHWHESSQKNTNGIGSLIAFETGLTDLIDIALNINQAYRQNGSHHTWVFGDMAIYLGIQPLHDKKHTWTPDLRIILGEVFPTGKYDRLNPQKRGSDIFGQGAYVSTLILVLAKTFYTFPKNPYNINFNFYYLHPSGASIHGYSLYGGANNTRGRVSPGAGFITNIAIEYSLNRFWALGADIRYVHQNKSSFRGKKDNASAVGLPSSEQFSLAPCLQYSWSEDFSIGVGPWFTVAGRNSVEFFALVGNIFCYF